MKEYKVTYSDRVFAQSKERALEIAIQEIELLFRKYATVKELRTEGK